MNERELLDRATLNSYEVITRKKTVEEIEETGAPVFVHYPDQPITRALLKSIAIYFIQKEDYIPCKEISDEYKSLFREEMPPLFCGCNTPDLRLLDDDTIQCRSCRTRII